MIKLSNQDITKADVTRLLRSLDTGGGVGIPFGPEETHPNGRELLRRAKEAVEGTDRCVVSGSKEGDDYLSFQYGCRKCVAEKGYHSVTEECPHGTKGLAPPLSWSLARRREAFKALEKRQG